MSRCNHAGRIAAVAILFMLFGPATSALAAVTDYEFQLVQPQVKKGEDASIAVRLIDKRSKKPVVDAVIFAQRIDMAPDGMETMTAPIERMRVPEPGIYRFKASLPMAGNWRLSIAAKVQGETGTLQSRLNLKVVP